MTGCLASAMSLHAYPYNWSEFRLPGLTAPAPSCTGAAVVLRLLGVLVSQQEGPSARSSTASGRFSLAGGNGGDGGPAGVDIMASSEWPGVAPADVLLSPGQCRTVWRQFSSDSTFTVQQVRAKLSSNRDITADVRWSRCHATTARF